MQRVIASERGGATVSLMPIIPGSQATAWRLDNAVSDGVTFDPTSGTALGSFSVSSLAWKPDGTRFYLPDGNESVGTGDVYIYDCSTAWDMDTATYAGVMLTNIGDANGVQFNDDGTKLIVQTDNNFHEVNLSAPYGSVFSSTSTNPANRENEGGFFFNADGSVIYYRSSQAANFYSAPLSTAYDMSTLGSETSISTAFMRGEMSLSRSGTRVLVTRAAVDGGELITEYSGDAYDFANFTAGETYTVTDARGAQYAENGTKLYTFISSTTISQHSTVG